jgi:hypothetical protein
VSRLRIKPLTDPNQDIMDIMDYGHIVLSWWPSVSGEMTAIPQLLYETAYSKYVSVTAWQRFILELCVAAQVAELLVISIIVVIRP